MLSQHSSIFYPDYFLNLTKSPPYWFWHLLAFLLSPSFFPFLFLFFLFINSPASKIYTTSPRNPTHPHQSKDRVEYGWNDGRTKNAQSRSQPAASKTKPRPSTNKKTATYAAGGNKVCNFTFTVS